MRKFLMTAAMAMTITPAFATSPQVSNHDMPMVEELANKITDDHQGFVGWGVNLYVATSDPRVARSVADTMCHQLASQLDDRWSVCLHDA